MEVVFRADLAITNVYLDENGVLTSELSNLGNLNVDPDSEGHVYIYVDDMEHPLKNYTWSLLADQAFLEAGGVSYIQSHTLDSDVHNVKVCIDPTDVVAETDEVNNCYETSFGADLAVTDVYLSGRLLSIDLANFGNIDINPTETHGSIFIYVDDMEDPVYAYNWTMLADNSFLKAGGSSTITPRVLEGSHTVMACVDATDAVTETDETNNCTQVVFGVADLAANNIYLTESNVLTIEMMNIGTEDVPADTEGQTALYVDNMETASTTYAWQEMADRTFFIVGGLSVLQPLVFEAATPGREVKVCMDSSEVVSESNEDNNCMQVTLRPTSSGDSGSGSGDSDDDEIILAGDDSTEDGLPFVDVSETHQYYDPIYEAWSLGMVHGRGALFFYPNAPILRGEAAKVIANVFGYQISAITGTYFPDVNEEDPEVAAYIEALAENGIIQGYGDGYFRPHQPPITVYEVKVIFRRLLGEVVVISSDADGSTITRGKFVEFIMQYVD